MLIFIYLSSIKYVTLFLANFEPLPMSDFVTHPGTPQKYVTHLGPPSLVDLVQKHPDKNPLYKFFLNCSRGFLSKGVCQGSFVWKVLSGVVLSVPPSVKMHLLQQKAKHHFKFQVPCV